MQGPHDHPLAILDDHVVGEGRQPCCLVRFTEERTVVAQCGSCRSVEWHAAGGAGLAIVERAGRLVRAGQLVEPCERIVEGAERVLVVHRDAGVVPPEHADHVIGGGSIVRSAVAPRADRAVGDREHLSLPLLHAELTARHEVVDPLLARAIGQCQVTACSGCERR